ncbi:MAG TPA: hypothetical protein K8U77_08760 [Slackia equolifaciens]|uniref:Uncharacterized protein n=1 Tax=Slackia equolifaciens TaxID=498718 RepID=A0A9D2UXL2_9ACTN|nr:hypothetical protein [Slackia equolifaciens]
MAIYPADEEEAALFASQQSPKHAYMAGKIISTPFWEHPIRPFGEKLTMRVKTNKHRAHLK